MSDAPRSCPLGCPEQGTTLGSLAKTAAFPLSRENYDLVRCGCGELVYLSPPPSPDDLRAMYVDNGQFGEEYTDAQRVARILDYIGECFRRLSVAGGFGAGQARVLEVGAGLAWMCRAAKQANAANVTVAQDVSPEAVGACPWVDHYVQAGIESAELERHGPYQVISMTHVIEHLVHPREAIARCRELLAPDGIIFITAPHRPRAWQPGDLDAWRRYSYNHVPAHVQYFAEGSMRRLAERCDCRVAYWSHDHEDGQAFEAWLTPKQAGVRGSPPSLTRRVVAYLARRLK